MPSRYSLFVKMHVTGIQNELIYQRNQDWKSITMEPDNSDNKLDLFCYKNTDVP